MSQLETDAPRLDTTILRTGQVLDAVHARVVPRQTVSPALYTQSSLMEAMGAAHLLADNDADREELRRTKGIGTARTRGPMLQGLFKAGVWLTTEQEGREFIVRPTKEARNLMGLLTGPLAVLRKVALTAQWQMAFGLIENGRASVDAVHNKIGVFIRGVFLSLAAMGSQQESAVVRKIERRNG